MGITWRTAAGIAVAALLGAACQSDQAGTPSSAAGTQARSTEVVLKDPGGRQVATALIVEGMAPQLASAARTASDSRLATPARTSPSPNSGVTIAIDVMDLSPGTHGFHVNSVGACDSPNFASSGAHLNPRNRSHGVKNANGPHAGDLPNLTVEEDHTALAVFFVGHLNMADIDASPNGASLLIDTNADDDMTDPDGGAGAHMACGVIRPGKQATPTPSMTPTSGSGAAGANTGTMMVAFSGLPQGTFPVHLHSTCNGSQTFHVTVLDNLVVGSQGSGSIAVPDQDFGHGWCVIVYRNSSLSTVLATRGI